MSLSSGSGAKRVTIVLRSMKEDRSNYIHLLEELRKLGAAEATAFQGVASFVGQHPIHTSHVVDIVPDLPVIIVWIDREDAVERILPQVLPLIKDGIVTVDDTNVVLHTSTEISDLAAGERVSDVMTRNVTSVRTGASLAEVVRDLLRRTFRSVPVVDDDNRVVGIMTNGDIVRRGNLAVRLDLLQSMPAGEQESILAALTASNLTSADVTTPDVVTVAQDAHVRDAAKLMMQHHLKRLPVVDAEGRLAGIVSRVDLLRTVARASMQPPGEPPHFTHESAASPIRQVMSKDVPVVGPDDPVSHLINVVVSTRLNRAVVIDTDRRPLGVVSDAELIERVTPEARPTFVATLMRHLPVIHGSEEAQETARHARGRTAKDFMRQDFVVVDESTPIGGALKKMLDEGRKIVLVTDKDGGLVGMVDRRDLLGSLV
jgi:CBS-domain-containing membrane protein